MTVRVLKDLQTIQHARRILRARRLSCLSPAWISWLRQRGLYPGISVGDDLKSWDILQTTEFAEAHVKRDGPVLDIGAYACEILCVLRRLGYENLCGIDLNPDVVRMRQAKRTQYYIADFLNSGLADESFAMITAISVIEHGFDAVRLLGEISRLLRRGGYFVASFDYWPEKLDTNGVKMFGMDWRIFSADEVSEFISLARSYGLTPLGEVDFDAQSQPIECFGRNYTFAWMALQKL